MPAEYSSFVRNWFVSDDGKVDSSKLSVEDKWAMCSATTR